MVIPEFADRWKEQKATFDKTTFLTRMNHNIKSLQFWFQDMLIFFKEENKELIKTELMELLCPDKESIKADVFLVDQNDR